MAGIDEWLPSYQIRTRHEITLNVPAEEAMTKALAAPAAPDRLVRLLFRLRGLRPEGSLAHFIAANGFTLLARTGTSYVAGIIVSPRVPVLQNAAEWRAPGRLAGVRAAVEFRAVPLEDGSRLTTETRVAAGSGFELLAFRLYWLFVGPFSSLIRRRWLRAIRDGRVAAA